MKKLCILQGPWLSKKAHSEDSRQPARMNLHCAHIFEAPNDDSIQNPRSLIRVIVVCMKKLCILQGPWLSITKTYLYNFDPLNPHFYIEKLGFTGVYIIFLISSKNIVCGYSLEPPRRGGSNEYPQSMF